MAGRAKLWTVLTLGLLVLATAALVDPVPARSQDDAAKDDSKSEESSQPSASTHEVQTEPFEIEVSFEGTFAPKKTAEVVLRPAEWKSFTVEKALPQGTRVKKGQTLVWVDTEGIDEQIRQLEFSRELARLSLEEAEIELATLEKTVPLDLASAKRTWEAAREDLQHYLEVEKGLTKESAQRSLESSQFSLEYAQEELDQLQKMYQSDDLTEDTEEIVLKRAKRAVDNAKYYLKRNRIHTDRTLETLLPRQEKSVVEQAKRYELTWKKTEASLPLTLQQKRISVEKAQHDLKNTDRKLARLKADRKLMDVVAPADGVLYHGSWEDGSWSLSSSVAKQLKKGGSLPTNTVFMTVVQTEPLAIRATVEEKEVQHVREAKSGKATPKAFPGRKLPCRVAEVSAFPTSPGKFDATLEVKPGDVRVVPGMTCTVKLLAYRNPKALAVPSKAVFTDGDGTNYVYVVEDGEPVKRTVKVGHASGSKKEILSGLKAGETIRLEKP